MCDQYYMKHTFGYSMLPFDNINPLYVKAATVNPGDVQAHLPNRNPTCGRGKYTRVEPINKQKLIFLVTKEKISIKKAARQLNINYSTAKSIIQVHRLQEEDWYTSAADYQPLPRGRPRKVTPEILASIQRCRKENPCISLAGILEYIQTQHNLPLCKATIHNYLKNINSDTTRRAIREE